MAATRATSGHSGRYDPTAEEVRQLLRRAAEHPLGPEFLAAGALDAVAATFGVATFGDLSINNAGTGYTLTASAGGLTGATSGLFDVLLAGGTINWINGSGGNWSLEKYNPWPGVMDNVPSSRGYSGGFMAELMTKDLGLAQEAAQATGSSTPMGALALQLYRLLLKQGNGKLDFSAVQKLFVEPR